MVNGKVFLPFSGKLLYLMKNYRVEMAFYYYDIGFDDGDVIQVPLEKLQSINV